MNKKKARVVLIGGSGFVGSYTNKLLKKNYNLICISSSKINLIKKKSINSLKKIVKENDIVVFFSAITPDKSKTVETFINNISMSKNCYEAIKEKKLKKFIYISSDAVYSASQSKVNEKTNPNPDDLYGLMHLIREKIFLNLKYFSVIILRPTLIYGNGDTHNSYGVNRFIRGVKFLKEIKLFGNGEEKRDHIYVEDVAKIIQSTIKKKCSGIFNLATGQSISYFNLASKVKKLVNKNKEVKIITSERFNKITHRFYDSRKIKKLTKINFIKLEKGIVKSKNIREI